MWVGLCHRKSRWFAVDADGVFVSPILGQFHGFVAGWVVENGAVPLKGVFWYTKTAGCLHRLHGQQHDLPQAGQGIEVSDPIGPVCISWANHAGGTVEPQDERGFVETAKHDGHPWVFEQVCGRFVATAGEIKIANGMVVKHPKRIHAFG